MNFTRSFHIPLLKTLQAELIAATLTIAVSCMIGVLIAKYPFSQLALLGAFICFCIIIGFSARYPKIALITYAFALPIFPLLLSSFVKRDAYSLGSSFSIAGAVKDVLLIALVSGWFIYHSQTKRALRFPHFFPIALFQCIAFISAIRSKELLLGLWSFRSYIEFFALYIITVNTLTSNKDSILLLRALIVSSVGVSLYVLLGSIGQDIGVSSDFNPFGSSTHIIGRIGFGDNFSSAGPLATYISLMMILSLCYMISVKKRMSWLVISCLFTGIPVLLLTFERRGWVIMAISIVFWGILTRYLRQTLTIIAAVTVIIVGILVLRPNVLPLIHIKLAAGIDDRIHIWASYIQEAADTYFLGSGLSAAGTAALAFEETYRFTPHNFFLLLLVQGGILFTIAFVGVSSVILKNGFSVFMRSPNVENRAIALAGTMGIIALIINSLISDTLEIYPFNAYFWLLAALCVSDAENNKFQAHFKDNSVHQKSNRLVPN